MKDSFSCKIKANLSKVGKPEDTPVDILETLAYSLKEGKTEERSSKKGIAYKRLPVSFYWVKRLRKVCQCFTTVFET